MLGKLLELSEEGAIKFTGKQLLEMSEEDHERINMEYVRGKCEQISKQFANAVVLGFGSVSEVAGLEGGAKLSQDLIRNKLFMDDLGSALSWIVPKLPYVGLVVGGVAIATTVCGYWSKSNDNDDADADAGTNSQQHAT